MDYIISLDMLSTYIFVGFWGFIFHSFSEFSIVNTTFHMRLLIKGADGVILVKCGSMIRHIRCIRQAVSSITTCHTPHGVEVEGLRCYPRQRYSVGGVSRDT